MKTFVGVLVAAPLSVDDLVSRTSRDVAVGAEASAAHVRHDVWIALGVFKVVKENAEGFLLEIVPGELSARIERKVGLGDPVSELLGVAEMRAPKDVPSDLVTSGRHGSGGPVHGAIPGSGASLPSLAVEPADVIGASFHAPNVVGQNAHELVATVEVAAIGVVENGTALGGDSTVAIEHFVGLGFPSTELVARRWVLHEPVALDRGEGVCHGGKRKENGGWEVHGCGGLVQGNCGVAV